MMGVDRGVDPRGSVGVARTGRILHLQRLSTEDGPGIRTTVFLKGCPLACQWCHNPESLSPNVEIQWNETRCIGCQTCIDACPNSCLTLTEVGVAIDRLCCRGCGECAQACPSGAMELLGRDMGVDELVAEIVKDRAYYEPSGGGATLSGGEPLLQPGFAVDLLMRLGEVGVQTALDTCGFCATERLIEALPLVDLLLFDVKEIDSRKHKTWTGQGNERVLENLVHVGQYLVDRQPEMRLWLRTPLIPGATASCENITGIGLFLSEHLDGLVERWELCAFNNLCRDKYERLGRCWAYAETPLLRARELEILTGCAMDSGVDPSIVVATGVTRP